MFTYSLKQGKHTFTIFTTLLLLLGVMGAAPTPVEAVQRTSAPVGALPVSTRPIKPVMAQSVFIPQVLPPLLDIAAIIAGGGHTGSSGTGARAAPMNSVITVSCNVVDLINAINTANTSPDADTLELPTGCNYHLTSVDNVEQYGNNGLPVITSDITINAHGAAIWQEYRSPVLIRTFDVKKGGTLRLNDITISGSATTVGGAIHNLGTLIINNGNFTKNVGDFGGAILNERELTISNTSFSENEGSIGGGILNNGTLNVSSSTFSENKALERGGAISTSGTATITNSTFSGNSACC